MSSVSLVRAADAHRAVHAHMHLDGDRRADTARAQVVRLPHFGIRRNDTQDFLFHILRKRTFQKFVESGANQVERDLENENRHDERRDRVGDAPLIAQKIGAPDAGERSQRRKGVAAVMPCVGRSCSDSTGGLRAPYSGKESPFDDDGTAAATVPRCRTGQQPSVETTRITDAVRQESPTPTAASAQADDDRGERLVFAVAVVVPRPGVWRKSWRRRSPPHRWPCRRTNGRRRPPWRRLSRIPPRV